MGMNDIVLVFVLPVTTYEQVMKGYSVVHTYFVNIFGAIQYRAVHDEIAKRFFDAFFKKNIFVGQLRTRLGIAGWERKGPEEAARALLHMISHEEK